MTPTFLGRLVRPDVAQDIRLKDMGELSGVLLWLTEPQPRVAARNAA